MSINIKALAEQAGMERVNLCLMDCTDEALTRFARAVLEEAVKVARHHDDSDRRSIAHAIRSLLPSEPTK